MPAPLPSFLAAAVPPRVSLGGRRIGPLTLGHCALLGVVRSPFAPFDRADAVEPTTGETSLAWYILTRPWTAARDGMDGRLARHLMRWHGIRSLVAGRDDASAMMSWIVAEASCPRHTRDRSAGEGSRGAHPLLILVDSLMRHHGMVWPTVLDTPVALAWHLHLSHWEEQGAIHISTAEEITALEAAQVDAATAAELAAWSATQAERRRTGRPYDPATDAPPQPRS